MAFKYALEGFLTPEMEHWACKVEEMQMPKRPEGSMLTHLDTALFATTLENFFVAWFMLKLY